MSQSSQSSAVGEIITLILAVILIGVIIYITSILNVVSYVFYRALNVSNTQFSSIGSSMSPIVGWALSIAFIVLIGGVIYELFRMIRGD